MKKEIRNTTLAASSALQTRRSSKGRIATGYAIVFAPSISEDLGGFVESISYNSVNLSRNNVWALRGHDTNKQLASTDASTLRLSKDSKGVRFEIDLPDTTDGNDIAELLSRGDGGRCSFGFVATSDRWEEKNDLILRTVTSLELLEISVGVIFPAYQDTTAAIRSAPESIRAKLTVKRDDTIDAEEERCDCSCAECLNGNCADCLDPECTEEDCELCGQQSRAALVSCLLRRRRF